MCFRPDVSVEVTDGIATVYLDRPDAGNRLSERMAAGIRDVFDSLDRDDGVRVVVIAGRGEAFCVGSDPPVNEPDFSQTADGLRISSRIAACAKPVIAALNGDAVDQGLEIALACDFRLASEDARLGLTQVGAGLLPWDGGTQRLPRLIGRGRTMEMVLTSRVVGAREAMEMGLVDSVVGRKDVLVEAWRLAETIATHGPIAARYAKEAVRTGCDLPLDQGLRLEADLNILLQSTDDRAEGIRSFLEKRPPTYRGR